MKILITISDIEKFLKKQGYPLKLDFKSDIFTFVNIVHCQFMLRKGKKSKYKQ